MSIEETFAAVLVGIAAITTVALAVIGRRTTRDTRRLAEAHPKAAWGNGTCGVTRRSATTFGACVMPARHRSDVHLDASGSSFLNR